MQIAKPGFTDEITIDIASADDLAAILELQYLAYQSEAILLNNFSIPPLKETLEDVRKQCLSGIILKAVSPENLIIGSIRGQVKEGTLFIGKLMVNPGYRGRGLGSRLLAELEARCPQPRFELFTSSKSVKNLVLYERSGYAQFMERQLSPDLRLIYLEKPGRKP